MPVLTLTLAAALLAPGALKLHEPTLDWRAARLAAVTEPAGGAPVPVTPRYPDPPSLEEIPPPPPPPVMVPPPAHPPSVERSSAAEVRLLYLAREKSVAAALLLELFTLPGVGLAYANAWPELAITMSAIGAGAGIFAVAAVTETRSFETFFVVGALFVGGARLFGIVASYFGVQRYNEGLREELGLTPQLLLAPQPGGAGAGVALRF